MSLTTDKLTDYRERLKQERGRVHQNVESLREEFAQTQSSSSMENGLETHMGDAGTDTFLRERDLSIEDQEIHLLKEIDEALTRIDNGTFGVCVSCGNAIAEDRLEAIPWAARCIDCQSRQ